MWQEARKQEKKLRGIMIDYKRRAERRQAFYQKMKLDPNQLIRVYGQKCKFHMPTENLKGISTDGQLMPWPGDPEIMIDRFDVRAHLDIIPDPVETPDDETVTSPTQEKFLRKCAYERYRTLVQIDATGASEEQYLKQLEVEEAQGKSEMEKRRQMIENAKSASKANAKIHYKYEDDSSTRKGGGDDSDDDSDEEDDSGDDTSDGELSDIDINVNVLELTEDQTNHLDALACQYGVGYGQYCKQLLLEKKEFEYVKKLEEEEEERAKMPGRKGKSARRTLRAKQKTLRGSPLSFALQEGLEPDLDDDKKNRGRSSSSSSESGRSKSPEESKVEFITEFGGDDEEESKKKQTGIIIPSASDSRKKAGEKDSFKKERSGSRSRSRSRSRGKDSRSSDRKSHRRDKRRSRSRDRRSRSRERRSRSRERRSRSRDGHKSRRQTDDRHHSSSSSRSRHHSSRSSRRSRSRSPRHKSSHRSRSPHSHRNKSRSKSPHQKSLHRSQSRSKSREKDARSASRSHSLDKNNGKSSRDRRSRSKSKSRSSSRESKEKETGKSRDASMERTSTSTPHGNIVKRLGAESSAAATAPVDKSALTPREKMKLRMQKLLNKQIKSDKKVEEKKKVLKEQADEERENDIYEMSKMMRDKYRDRRRSEFPTSRGPSEGSPVSNPRRTESRESRSTELPYFDASTFRYEGND